MESEASSTATTNTKNSNGGKLPTFENLHPCMPPKLRHLFSLFSAMEFGLSSLNLYQHSPAFDAVKRAVESSSQSTFTLSHLQSIAHLAPELYYFSQKPPPKSSKSQVPILLVHRRTVSSKPESMEDSSRQTTTPLSLSDRIDFFGTKLNAVITTEIELKEEYQGLSRDEIQLRLEKDLEIQSPALQIVEETKGSTSLNSKRPRNAMMEKEIDEEVSEEVKEALTAPIPPELDDLPTWLITKVRKQEQATKRSVLKQKKSDAVRMVETLPELSAQIQSYTLFARKTTFLLSDLEEHITHPPMKGKVKEQVYMLEEIVPFWLQVHLQDGEEYVKLTKRYTFKKVKAALQDHLRTYTLSS